QTPGRRRPDARAPSRRSSRCSRADKQSSRTAPRATRAIRRGKADLSGGTDDVFVPGRLTRHGRRRTDAIGGAPGSRPGRGRGVEVMTRQYAIVEAPSVLGLRPTGVERLPDALMRAGLDAQLRARRAARVEPPPYDHRRDPETLMLNAQGIAT